jgi:integrase
MGKSHQAGWVVPRGKKWYGYYRRTVLDPIANQQKVDVVSVILGLKSQMTKFEAREALTAEVTKQTGQNLGGRILNDSSVTFGWFVRNRYYPLREANWKPETAKVKKIQIQRDLVEKFESVPLDAFDKFMLQTHINNLASLRSKDRVLQARSYLKSIFSEAVEQDFLQKDPSRKLGIPKELRRKDKTVLTWEQLRLVLARLTARDRVLVTLEMIEALRPSELFALRWKSFDGSKLTITETVYKGKIRPWGKTERSLGDVHLPKGLALDLLLWKRVCPDPAPGAFIFPNADKGFIDTGNYRSRVLSPLAEELKLPKLNFQVLRRTMATLAQKKGSVKDIQAHLRHAKADTTANEYMQELPESVKQMVDSVYRELKTVPKKGSAGQRKLLPKATKRATKREDRGVAGGELLPIATKGKNRPAASY